MTEVELIATLDRMRDDLHDHVITEEEYVQWIAAIFDGDVAFALELESAQLPSVKEAPRDGE